MPPTRLGNLLLILLAGLFLIIGAIALSSPASDANVFRLFIRLCALYGFLMMAIAAIMTPFLSAVHRIFGKPFLTIHHVFAVFGIVLGTLHPVAFAIQITNPAVFLPRAQSWTDFWANAGRPALILMYIALAAALLRSRWKQWRYLHAVMYLALLFAYIHGTLVGTDFARIEIRILYTVIFAAVVVAFFLGIRKKWQRRNQRAAASR